MYVYLSVIIAFLDIALVLLRVLLFLHTSSSWSSLHVCVREQCSTTPSLTPKRQNENEQSVPEKLTIAYYLLSTFDMCTERHQHSLFRSGTSF